MHCPDILKLNSRKKKIILTKLKNIYSYIDIYFLF